MLTKSEIIAAVCRHLKKRGWTIVSICNELQRGDDILAEHRGSGRTVVIEAKGETSSKGEFAAPWKAVQFGASVQSRFARFLPRRSDSWQ